MLDSGGYSGTDWSTTEVIDMWLAICNQDTAPHWQVVSGWRKSYELTSEHLSAVKSYRKNLIDAWPPEKNAASAAYVERLDTLIDHLQQTYDSAVANHQALSDVASSLSISRAKLGPIVDEYYANERALQKFNTTEPPLVAGHGKTKAAPPKPPVPDGRQEELASQARSIMYGLGRDLTTAQGKLTQPAVYIPATGREKEGHETGGSGYSGPTVPAVVPFDPRSTSSPASGHEISSLPATHTASPIEGSASSSPSVPRQPGLVLGGFHQPPATIAPPTTGSPSGPLVGGGSSPTPPVVAPTPPLALGPVGESSTKTPTSMTGPRGQIGEPFGRGGVSGLRAMPPGGVIGGAPGMGLGQPDSNGRSIQRVNPPGGVIDPGRSSSRSGVGARSGAMQREQFISPHGRSGNREESDDSLRWDPDNPWETSEGVAPVVLPVDEQQINPGPAIGLS